MAMTNTSSYVISFGASGFRNITITEAMVDDVTALNDTNIYDLLDYLNTTLSPGDYADPQYVSQTHSDSETINL